MPNQKKYLDQIRKAYIQVIKEISLLAIPISFTPGDEFYFKNYPTLNKKVNALLERLFSEVKGITIEGINSEWDLAVNKNNELAYYAFGKSIEELPTQFKNKYLSGNDGARRAFVARKINGLNLSDRIWKNTKQFKQEMELALELGIGRGYSADTIARQIQQYLNAPDKLFRRVRSESGTLRLSKAAKAYTPGQGVYRSSYRNALRVTRNETNFAYEASNLEKRKQQDFVVGVRITTSPSHNPASDKGGISCTDLQGDYPKDFDFTYKWHVNCKCVSTDIIKTPEEMDKDTDLILAGEQPSTPSVNAVPKLPKKFTSYVKINEKLWKNWKTKPKFLVNIP